jgi:hypothetical protein
LRLLKLRNRLAILCRLGVKIAFDRLGPAKVMTPPPGRNRQADNSAPESRRKADSPMRFDTVHVPSDLADYALKPAAHVGVLKEGAKLT